MRRWIPAVIVAFLTPACGREAPLAQLESPTPTPMATSRAIETPAPTVSPSPAAATAAPARTTSASGISGRVVHGPVCTPGETDCEGRPIHGVDVKANSEDGRETIRGTYTDEEGRFSIPLPPGTYIVVIATRSFPRCDQKTVDVLAGYYTPVHLTCDAGEPGT